MTSQVKIVEKKRGKWTWPVLGLILALAVTVIAWFISPEVVTWAQKTFSFTRAETGMTKQSLQIIFTVGVAGIMLLVAVMIVSLAGRRKRPTDVNNSVLEKDRRQMIADKKAMKKRQRRLNQQMREHVKNNPKV